MVIEFPLEKQHKSFKKLREKSRFNTSGIKSGTERLGFLYKQVFHAYRVSCGRTPSLSN